MFLAKKILLLFLFVPSLAFGQLQNYLQALSPDSAVVLYGRPTSTTPIRSVIEAFGVATDSIMSSLVKRTGFNLRDYSSLQGAYDALPDSGGAILIPTDSVFSITKLTLSKPFTIISGAGGYGTLEIAATTSTYGGGNEMITNDSTNVLRYIKFENIRFTDTDTSGGIFVRLLKCVEVVFNNCIFEGSGSSGVVATQIYRTVGRTFTGCTFIDLNQSITTGSSGSTVLGFEGDHAISGYPKFIFIGNKGYNLTVGVIHDLPDHEPQDANPVDSSFAVVANNLLYGSSGALAAIGMQHMSKVVIANNVCINWAAGIDAETADEAIIANNYLYGRFAGENSGIRVASTNQDTAQYKFTITGNQMYNFGDYGVGIDGVGVGDSSGYFIISNNLIKDVGEDGIFIEDLRRGIISNNLFIDNNRDLTHHGGVRFSVSGTARDIMVHDNMFINSRETPGDTTMTYGVVLQGTTSGINVSDNHFINMNTDEIFGTPSYNVLNYGDIPKIAIQDSLTISTSSGNDIKLLPAGTGEVEIGNTTDGSRLVVVNTDSALIYLNRNAGSTAHTGIVYGATANPTAAFAGGNPVSPTGGEFKIFTENNGTMVQAIKVDSAQDVFHASKVYVDGTTHYFEVIADTLCAIKGADTTRVNPPRP